MQSLKSIFRKGVIEINNKEKIKLDKILEDIFKELADIQEEIEEAEEAYLKLEERISKLEKIVIKEA